MTHRPPLVVVSAYVALGVGSTAGLCWLAPLEYATGRWLGLGVGLAAVVPALIDSYVVLSVLTARDRRWALPIAALSGGVGQLHAAGVLPETSLTARGRVAAMAVLLAVAVTARLKPLVQEVLLAVRLAEDTAREAAVRAHAAAVDADRAGARDAAREAHERAMEAERTAHAQRLAEQAHAAALAARAPAPDPARAPRTPRRTAGARKPAATAHAGSDLQRRTSAREGFEQSVRDRTPWDNTRLACALDGCTDACTDDAHKPRPGRLRAAAAAASRWRTVVDGEQRTDEAAR